MNIADLRVALFSGNYNYVRDGANQALNRLADYLLRNGAAVRVYAPVVEKPDFEPTGDLVGVPSVPVPGRSEYRMPLRLSEEVKRDLAAYAPNVVHVTSPDPVGHRASDILSALRLARDYNLRLIVSGASEGWIVARELAAANTPVVVNPMNNIPGMESLGITLENAARMHGAGVNVVFASFDSHNSRNLKQLAGNAVSYGMPYDAALRALTVAPARLWGVADRYGTLEAGKDADVVVWSGDPLELTTAVEHVFINGREMPDDTRQRALFNRYRRLGGALPEAYVK